MFGHFPRLARCQPNEYLEFRSRPQAEFAGTVEDNAMAKCYFCGKGPTFGHNRSHAMNATRKIIKPNLGKKRLVIEGQEKQVNVCARCVRSLEKQGKLQIAGS